MKAASAAAEYGPLRAARSRIRLAASVPSLRTRRRRSGGAPNRFQHRAIEQEGQRETFNGRQCQHALLRLARHRPHQPAAHRVEKRRPSRSLMPLPFSEQRDCGQRQPSQEAPGDKQIAFRPLRGQYLQGALGGGTEAPVEDGLNRVGRPWQCGSYGIVVSLHRRLPRDGISVAFTACGVSQGKDRRGIDQARMPRPAWSSPSQRSAPCAGGPASAADPPGPRSSASPYRPHRRRA